MGLGFAMLRLMLRLCIFELCWSDVELVESKKTSFRGKWENLTEGMASDLCFTVEIFKHLEAGTLSRSNLRGDLGTGFAMLKGRRASQEDNVISMPRIELPTFATEAESGYSVSLFAVFDGHGGKEASELCSNCLDKYFFIHMYNLSMHFLDDPKSFSALSASESTLEDYFYKPIMKEALLRAIHDVDKVLHQNEAESGSTACIVLEAGQHILIANVGDSKALLCSSNTENFWAKELTSDHRPNREDENERIISAGGYVTQWGDIARVNGILAVSRSLGDTSFKRYGVTSEAEVTDWHMIADNDEFLVIATDGIFENMSTDDVCRVIEGVENGIEVSKVLRENFMNIKIPIALLPPSKQQEGPQSEAQSDFEASVKEEKARIFFHPMQKLAGVIAQAALKVGSGDNVAVVVHRLGSNTTNSKPATTAVNQTVSTNLNKTVSLESREKEMISGTLGDKGNSMCYALREPLVREEISPVRHGNNVRKDNGSSPIVPVLVTGERNGNSVENGWQLDVRKEFVTSIEDSTYPRLEKLRRFLDRIASVPVDTESMLSHSSVEEASDDEESLPFQSRHYRYFLKKRFSRGSFGELWLAVRRKCYTNTSASSYNWKFIDTAVNEGDKINASEEEVFVLKQILLDDDHQSVRLSGLREKHFGELFSNASTKKCSSMSGCDDGDDGDDGDVDDGVNHIARYVDSFEIEGKELWLVFKREGESLSRLLYQSQDHTSPLQLLTPSPWWRWLRTTPAGQDEMRHLLRQLLLAVKACHSRNITHRDIKPENMVVSGESNRNLILRLIDFGSAIDPFTLQHLYGPYGPTRNEHTAEYSPPEASLLMHWLHFHPHQTTAYDMWSVGVVMMEMILGTPHVFQISSRTRVMLDRHLDGWDEDSRNVAYMLRALLEMCILVPRVPPHHRHHENMNDNEGHLASMDCTEAALMHKIRQRDPLGLGIADVWSLRLIRELLQWYPEDRITVDEALAHPYFHPLHSQ